MVFISVIDGESYTENRALSRILCPSCAMRIERSCCLLIMYHSFCGLCLIPSYTLSQYRTGETKTLWVCKLRAREIGYVLSRPFTYRSSTPCELYSTRVFGDCMRCVLAVIVRCVAVCFSELSIAGDWQSVYRSLGSLLTGSKDPS